MVLVVHDLRIFIGSENIFKLAQISNLKFIPHIIRLPQKLFSFCQARVIQEFFLVGFGPVVDLRSILLNCVPLKTTRCCWITIFSNLFSNSAFTDNTWNETARILRVSRMKLRAFTEYVALCKSSRRFQKRQMKFNILILRIHRMKQSIYRVLFRICKSILNLNMYISELKTIKASNLSFLIRSSDGFF